MIFGKAFTPTRHGYAIFGFSALCRIESTARNWICRFAGKGPLFDSSASNKYAIRKSAFSFCSQISGVTFQERSILLWFLSLLIFRNHNLLWFHPRKQTKA